MATDDNVNDESTGLEAPMSGAVEEDTPSTEVPPPAEPPEAAAARLEAELESLRDRHLRVAAEYENFRKRTARERTELWARAQADVVGNILDAIDDLGRVADIDATQASAGDVIQGVELVERKLVRELENAGLERVGAVDEPFDPNHHEAIGSVPAARVEEDHTVGTVLQYGYRFGGTLIRPARVQVRLWQGDAAASGSGEARTEGQG